jgi:PemK-like, MazF-like toxin of type II toxin-antitoxin system
MTSAWSATVSRLRRLLTGRRPATTGHPLRGRPTGRYLDYAPKKNGRADPGEVVWTWVAYEDDPTQGKDRPVLVVGRDGARLLGLMLSSQPDHDRHRTWLALGPGQWDRERRPSWVRLDRVIVVPEYSIRREGAVLDRARFDWVSDALRRDHGWR